MLWGFQAIRVVRINVSFHISHLRIPKAVYRQKQQAPFNTSVGGSDLI